MRRGCVGRAGALGVALMAAACGDDGGEGGDDPNASEVPGAGRWAVPRVWTAGEALGWAVVVDQTVEPFELSEAVADRTCAYDVQFALPTATGRLPQSDREGECLVTSTVGLETLPQDQLDPLCADTVTLATNNPGFGATLDLCNPSGALAPPIERSCALLDQRPDALRVASGVGTDPADVVTMLDASVPRPASVQVTAPERLPSGIAVWPAGPLALAWTVPGTPGAYVEVVVRPRDGGGDAIRCLTADDGAFTVPERLVSAERARSVVVELVRTAQTVATTDGFPVRLSYQVQTALQLTPAR